MASKSTLSYRRGVFAEDYVKKYFISREFKILAERIKIHQIEVDLIVQKDKSIFLLEVKSLSNDWSVFERVSKKQLLRLKKALVVMRYQHINASVKGYIVYVSYSNRLDFISIDDTD